MFLATVGVNAGQPFVRTVAESGFTMLFIGVAVLLTTVFIVLLVGHYLDENSVRRSRRRGIRRDRKSGHPRLLDQDGADRTARHRLRHDLSVDDAGEGDRGADRRMFTGNNLIVMAWASGKVTTRALLRNWAIVFAGNSVGALLTAALMFVSTQYTFGDGAVGLAALKTANAKASLAFVPALTLGIMCNALVCLGVWMCYSARTTVGKIFAIVPPVAAFVAAGFEHSIANIYFIPLALFIKAGAAEPFWTSIGMTGADFPALTWSNFLVGNLLPVTIGNIIGGSAMVAATYWFVYLRKSKSVGANYR
jgi:formate/nitrite transporter